MVEEEATCELISFQSALIHMMGSYFIHVYDSSSKASSVCSFDDTALCVWL